LRPYSDIDLLKLHNQKHKSKYKQERGWADNKLNQTLMDMVYTQNIKREDETQSQQQPLLATEKVEVNENIFTNDKKQSNEYPIELDVQQIKAIFDKYDTNSSGIIGYNEFRKIVNELGIQLTSSEILMSFMVLDTNNDNNIFWEDFISWFNDLKQLCWK